MVLPFQDRVDHEVESFIVASSNRHAFDWIGRWPDWPFTALVLVGPAGCGKTHLASLWQKNSNATAADLATLGIERAAALTGGGEPILVEDCDAALDETRSERTLLQLYNLAKVSGSRLLLTARRPPSQWRLQLPDLQSRLNSAMVVAIDPADDELLRKVLVKLFEDKQVEVKEELLAYLLLRCERTVSSVAQAVETLNLVGKERLRPITVPLAREVLFQSEGD